MAEAGDGDLLVSLDADTVAAPGYRMNARRRRANRKVLCAQSLELSKLLGGVRDHEGEEA